MRLLLNSQALLATGSVVLSLCLALSSVSHAAVPVVFSFLDSPGEGFFDTSPLTGQTVMGASTVGEARRLVVQAAGDHIGSFFDTSFANEQWLIDAEFNPTNVNESIASAGPIDGGNGSSFSGGMANVWYPATLANHVAGSTIFSGSAVESEFNSNINWDYSLTGPPTVGEESLFSTAVHEVLHGLGFLSDVEQNGNYFDGIPSIFDTLLYRGSTPVTSLSRSQRAQSLTSNNLFFRGPEAMAANPLGEGPVKIHAPSSFETGSTGSHLDREAFASIGDLMLPEASALVPEQIFLSTLDVAMMSDLGYTLAATDAVIAGDYNADGTVDAADYTVWRAAASNATLPGDATPGVVDATDYAVWRSAYGSTESTGSTQLAAVPEPSSSLLLLAGCVLGVSQRQRTA